MKIVTRIYDSRRDYTVWVDDMVYINLEVYDVDLGKTMLYSKAGRFSDLVDENGNKTDIPDDIIGFDKLNRLHRFTKSDYRLMTLLEHIQTTSYSMNEFDDRFLSVRPPHTFTNIFNYIINNFENCRIVGNILHVSLEVFDLDYLEFEIKDLKAFAKLITMKV